jgi:hypothetical protein
VTNIAVVVFSRSPASGECPHCVLLVVIFPWQCNNYLHSRRSTGVGCSRFGFEAWAMRVGLTGGQALPITLSVASFLVGRLPRGGQPLERFPRKESREGFPSYGKRDSIPRQNVGGIDG